MEKIICKQVIPNEAIEKTPNIVGYAIDMMVRKITEELGNILCDRREYVVKMESPTIEDAIAFNSTEYKACIKYEPLVRCKDCKHRPIKEDADGENYGFNLIKPNDGDGLCPCLVFDRWYSWMPKDDFYCGYGEREGE